MKTKKSAGNCGKSGALSLALNSPNCNFEIGRKGGGGIFPDWFESISEKTIFCTSNIVQTHGCNPSQKYRFLVNFRSSSGNIALLLPSNFCRMAPRQLGRAARFRYTIKSNFFCVFCPSALMKFLCLSVSTNEMAIKTKKHFSEGFVVFLNICLFFFFRKTSSS